MLKLGQEFGGILKRAVFSGEFKSFLVCRYALESIMKNTKVSSGEVKVKKYYQSTMTLEVELGGVLVGQRVRNQETVIIQEVNQKIGSCCLRKIRYRLFS